jgi:sugar/nucleoside kinase (ribokinase family)
MNKLLIVGTVAFDTIKTPFGKAERILGGSGTYIGICSSIFEIKNSIVSVVGGDFKEKNLTLLQNKNIDISGIEIVKNGKTFFWEGVYHKNMNHRDTINTELNVLADFDPKVPSNYNDPKIVLLGNLHPLIQLKVISQLKNNPDLIILDTMNYWMDNSLSELLNVISQVDLLCINDQEAQQLTNENNLDIAAKKLFILGPKYLIIKKGGDGSTIYSKNNSFNCNVFPTKKVKDPTGAGDSFAGGLAGYLTKCNTISFNDVKEGVIYGTALASLCIEDFGPNNILKIDSKIVDERVAEIKRLN